MLQEKLFKCSVVSTRSCLAVKTGPDTMLSSMLSRLTENKHAGSHDELVYSHPLSTR